MGWYRHGNEYSHQRLTSCTGPSNVTKTITFDYAPGTTTFGIGLSNFQSLDSPAFPITNHELFVNGLDEGTIETLAGTNWAPGLGNRPVTKRRSRVGPRRELLPGIVGPASSRTSHPWSLGGSGGAGLKAKDCGHKDCPPTRRRSAAPMCRNPRRSPGRSDTEPATGNPTASTTAASNVRARSRFACDRSVPATGLRVGADRQRFGVAL
jgi:hypothetical protein